MVCWRRVLRVALLVFLVCDQDFSTVHAATIHQDSPTAAGSTDPSMQSDASTLTSEFTPSGSAPADVERPATKQALTTIHIVSWVLALSLIVIAIATWAAEKADRKKANPPPDRLKYNVMRPEGREAFLEAVIVYWSRQPLMPLYFVMIGVIISSIYSLILITLLVHNGLLNPLAAFYVHSILSAVSGSIFGYSLSGTSIIANSGSKQSIESGVWLITKKCCFVLASVFVTANVQQSLAWLTGGDDLSPEKPLMTAISSSISIVVSTLLGSVVNQPGFIRWHAIVVGILFIVGVTACVCHFVFVIPFSEPNFHRQPKNLLGIPIPVMVLVLLIFVLVEALLLYGALKIVQPAFSRARRHRKDGETMLHAARRQLLRAIRREFSDHTADLLFDRIRAIGVLCILLTIVFFIVGCVGIAAAGQGKYLEMKANEAESGLRKFWEEKASTHQRIRQHHETIEAVDDEILQMKKHWDFGKSYTGQWTHLEQLYELRRHYLAGFTSGTGSENVLDDFPDLASEVAGKVKSMGDREEGMRQFAVGKVLAECVFGFSILPILVVALAFLVQKNESETIAEKMQKIDAVREENQRTSAPVVVKKEKSKVGGSVVGNVGDRVVKKEKSGKTELKGTELKKPDAKKSVVKAPP